MARKCCSPPPSMANRSGFFASTWPVGDRRLEGTATVRVARCVADGHGWCSSAPPGGEDLFALPLARQCGPPSRPARWCRADGQRRLRRPIARLYAVAHDGAAVLDAALESDADEIVIGAATGSADALGRCYGIGWLVGAVAATGSSRSHTAGGRRCSRVRGRHRFRRDGERRPRADAGMLLPFRRCAPHARCSPPCMQPASSWNVASAAVRHPQRAAHLLRTGVSFTNAHEFGYSVSPEKAAATPRRWNVAQPARGPPGPPRAAPRGGTADLRPTGRLAAPRRTPGACGRRFLWRGAPPGTSVPPATGPSRVLRLRARRHRLAARVDEDRWSAPPPCGRTPTAVRCGASDAGRNHSCSCAACNGAVSRTGHA